MEQTFLIQAEKLLLSKQDKNLGTRIYLQVPRVTPKTPMSIHEYFPWLSSLLWDLPVVINIIPRHCSDFSVTYCISRIFTIIISYFFYGHVNCTYQGNVRSESRGQCVSFKGCANFINVAKIPEICVHVLIIQS